MPFCRRVHVAALPLVNRLFLPRCTLIPAPERRKAMRWLVCLLVVTVIPSSLASDPIKLDPDNPHYLLFRGQPTILISAAEHFGAVVNLDFDYIPYLNELKTYGFNLTQVFSGVMVEDEKSNQLGYNNPLAPRPGRLMAPWARSSVPGYANGGNKFDLNEFDPKYFSRLKDFVAEANKRGIVVGIQLFWSYYRDDIWNLSPLNARNNINGVGKGDRSSPYDLSDPAITEVQTAMVRKFVSELRGYDNVYYEVADGPTLGSESEAWSDHIIATIVQVEGALPAPHLISQTMSGWKERSANPAVSIFDFPGPSSEKIALNDHLPKINAFANIVGLGTGDKAYRLRGWELILAGGAVFLCRDFSFTPDYEAGAPFLPPGNYGGGSRSLRKQLEILKDFIYGFNFIRMSPDPAVVKSVPQGATVRALSEPGRAYAIYIGPKQVPTTYYSVRWTGQVTPRYSETYTFYTRTDDGARLRINGKLLIDNWTTHPVTEDSAQITLSGGQRYALEMEYFQANAGAEARLLWSSQSQPKEAIPRSQLSRPDESGVGLKGEYYLDLSMRQLETTRYDDQINFNWNGISPFPIVNDRPQTRSDLVLDLPAGFYRGSWMETATGRIFRTEKFKSAGGANKMILPAYSEGIVLSIRRVQNGK